MTKVIQLKPRKGQGVLLFSVALMSAEGEIIGHLQKVHIIVPRDGGKTFEGADIRVETTQNSVVARFEIPLK